MYPEPHDDFDKAPTEDEAVLEWVLRDGCFTAARTEEIRVSCQDEEEHHPYRSCSSLVGLPGELVGRGQTLGVPVASRYLFD